MISSVDNVYPTATYPLIIGVLTCLHPLAGTYSRIAVQMIGQLSTTEVSRSFGHALRISQK